MSYTVVHNGSYPESRVTANAIVIAGRYNGLKIASENVGVTEIKNYSAINVVPALTTPHGKVSCIGALKYVATAKVGSTLAGANQFEQASVDQWLAYYPQIVSRYEILKNCADGDKISNLRNLADFLKPLNDVLSYHTYLVGNTFTVADILLALNLIPAFENVFGPKIRTQLSAITRWFNTVVGQVNVQKVIGQVTVQEKDVHIPAELSTAAPKKAVRVVNPLDQLPKSPMVLDDIKRLYCAKRPFNPEFPTEFWPLFDAEGWSIMTVEFKYKDDWEKDFMAENMINGFINRSDACRRYCLGNLNLYFDGTYYQAKGAYLVRGQGVPQVLIDVTDYDEYEGIVLDSSNEEHRKQWMDLMCAEKVNGFDVLSRHVLK